MIGERRAAVRVESVGLLTNIFDGRSALLGVVADVSRKGIRVSALPAAFEESVGTCYAVVNGPEQDFHLALQPRWVRPGQRGITKMVGFQIQRPPLGWAKYIDRMEHDRETGIVLAA